MTYKIVLVFAFLAIAHGAAVAVTTDSPQTSAFAVAPGAVFTNTTLATNLAADANYTGGVVYTGGFDNTTNYAWIFNRTGQLAADPYTILRVPINASAPGSSNATAVASITTTYCSDDVTSDASAIDTLTNTKIMTAGGPGYLGVATVCTLSTYPNVYIGYVWANMTTATRVEITSNAASTTAVYNLISFWYDAGIFYLIYETATSSAVTGHYIQAVAANVSATTAYYNTSGGVNLNYISAGTPGSVTGVAAGQNYSDSTTGSTTFTYLYRNTIPSQPTISYIAITAATGVAATAVTVTTDPTAITGTAATVTTTTAAYSIAGAFGSYSTWGFAVTLATTYVSTATTYGYATTTYINGTTASSTVNVTAATSYYMPMVSGVTTSTGFDLFVSSSTSAAGASPWIIYMNSYYYNGTAIASTSLGTYNSIPQLFVDYLGSPWLGYTSFLTIAVDATHYVTYIGGGTAGEIAYNNLSAASVLSSIFATLALMVAALFAF